MLSPCSPNSLNKFQIMSLTPILSSAFPIPINDFPNTPSSGIFGSYSMRNALAEIRFVHPLACAVLTQLYYNCTGPTFNWSASEVNGLTVRLSGTEIASFQLFDRTSSSADLVFYSFEGSMARTAITGFDKYWCGFDTSNNPIVRTVPVPPSANFTGNLVPYLSFSEFPNSSIGERPWVIMEIFYNGILPVNPQSPFKSTTVWQKFIRSNDSPYAFQNDPVGAPGNALSIGEGLRSSGRITDYTVFSATLLLHTSSPLTIDRALGRVLSGTEIVYQCPPGKRFIVSMSGNLTLTAARTFTLLRCVNAAGGIVLVDISLSSLNANNEQLVNVADVQIATPIGITISILEFDNIPDLP